MGSELDKLSEGNIAVALVEMRGEFRTVAAEVRGSVEGLRMAIDAQANAHAMGTKSTADSIARMESHQREQGQQLRKLDPVPKELIDIETRMTNAETRIGILERDRARIFGFILGAAAVGGGIGSFIATIFGAS